jgi:hypothetical protein
MQQFARALSDIAGMTQDKTKRCKDFPYFGRPEFPLDLKIMLTTENCINESRDLHPGIRIQIGPKDVGSCLSIMYLCRSHYVDKGEGDAALGVPRCIVCAIHPR